jgi:glycosyltransferase involved in cell wall biosynthesis
VKVFLDLYHLHPSRALGQENAARCLIRGLSELQNRSELKVSIELGLSWEMLEFGFDPCGFEVDGTKVSSSNPLTRVWQQQWVSKDSAYFALGNTVKFFSSMGTGVTIHDLHHRHYSELYSPLKRAFYRYWAESSWKLAKLRVVPSRFVCEELKQFCGLSSQVIGWSPEPIAGLTAKSRQERGQYFLSVSSSAPHKRVSEMLQAFSGYRQKGGKMNWVHVGPRPSDLNSVEAVELVDFCDPAQLASLYSRAHAYMSASEFEGYGLPVAESLYWGTPVVLSPVASHVELAREGEVLWVPRVRVGEWSPEDHKVWVEALFDAERLPRLDLESGTHGKRRWVDVARDYQSAWLNAFGAR